MNTRRVQLLAKGELRSIFIDTNDGWDFEQTSGLLEITAVVRVGEDAAKLALGTEADGMVVYHCPGSCQSSESLPDYLASPANPIEQHGLLSPRMSTLILLFVDGCWERNFKSMAVAMTSSASFSAEILRALSADSCVSPLADRSTALLQKRSISSIAFATSGRGRKVNSLLTSV